MTWWQRSRGQDRQPADPDRATRDHDAVAAAFVAVPRDGFLPEAQRWRSAVDGPLEIGHGQTNSQPRTVADMLRLLDVQPRQRVLDVGAGSGWTTALLATLVGPGGFVLGLERVPGLARWGGENLRRHAVGRTDLGQATLELADPGELGRASGGPWDRILVSAMARALPSALVDQLADGGRMVCPVAGRMVLVERRGDEVAVSSHGAYRFVPLIEP